MRTTINLKAVYSPITCYIKIQKRHPLNWVKKLQPYVKQLHSFKAIYKTYAKAVYQLAKLSNTNEIELVEAAFYSILKQNTMNTFKAELDSITAKLNQYKKQLHYLQSPNNTMSHPDKVIISKHYQENIKALSIRKQQLTEAIEIEYITVEPVKTNC